MSDSFHLEVGGGGHLAPHLAVHDDLTAHIAAGLEEDGVHPDIRLDAGCLGLHHLRPAHFQPIAGDEAVQRHVLALEGGHAVAVLRKNAAERRAQQAFARAAHRALDHDAPGVAHAKHLRKGLEQLLVFRRRAHGGAVPAAVQGQDNLRSCAGQRPSAARSRPAFWGLWNKQIIGAPVQHPQPQRPQAGGQQGPLAPR